MPSMIVTAALLLGVVAQPGMESPFHSRLESEVVAELNRTRTDPRGYAEHLRELRRSFRDRFTFVDEGVAFLTKEGVAAVDEAIAFLMTVPAAPKLKGSRGLSRAARDHMRDQALRGGTGHMGSDGSDPVSRMSRYGRVDSQGAAFPAWKILAGEIIGYGRQEARAVVVMLIVDDGVPDRGHRLAIFNPSYTQVGVAFGTHLLFNWLCVIDFAGDFQEKGE